MNATIQDTLLDLFHQVIEDPNRMPNVPIGAWPEVSEEQHLLTGFHDMLERMQQSKQQAEEQLRERVANLGGTFEIVSTPGNGTCICVQVPGSV